MRVYSSIDSFHSDTRPVVTVGVFDGVHRGHREILEMLKSIAQDTNTETVVITFDPHPRLVLGNSSDVMLLNSLDEKIQLIRKTGIDALIIVPFDAHFARTDPGQFIRDVLIGKLHASAVITGYDHFFGHGRLGDFTLLEKLGNESGFTVHQVSPVSHCQQTVSSSAIRQALLSGETAAANCMLGYPYSLKGRVVRGNQIGKLIGYPTANLQAIDNNKLIPAQGVYASLVKWNGNLYKGMSNIGIRPTIEANRLTVEVNIFDFEEDIYTESITLYFLERIRDEKKFGGLEQLKVQLADDRLKVMELFSGGKYDLISV